MQASVLSVALGAVAGLATGPPATPAQEALVAAAATTRDDRSRAYTPLSLNRQVSAAGIRNRDDLRAFVHAAEQYAFGATWTPEVPAPDRAEAFARVRRAFREDAHWSRGPVSIYVHGNTARGEEAEAFVPPPESAPEGGYRGPLRDRFGNDYFKETERIVTQFGGGYVYYSAPSPLTGADELQVGYVLPLDWNGTPAVIGAALPERDAPGACAPGAVNARSLAADPTPDRLQALVRCAAYRVEAGGLLATRELARDSRWNAGSIYAFGSDLAGAQVYSGSAPGRNGEPSEIGDLAAKLAGRRDVLAAAAAFGESFLYYEHENPATGAPQRKVAFVKRVLAQGAPILVGSGYYLADGASVAGAGLPACADRAVAASAISTQEDLQAFVLCARAYAARYGAEEAAQGFNLSPHWRSWPYYLYVSRLPWSGLAGAIPFDTRFAVVRQDRESRSAAPLLELFNINFAEEFGDSFFAEEARLARDFGGGWIYSAGRNPASGRTEHKAWYTAVIDDWDGAPAVIGAAMAPRHAPGNCAPGQVNATSVAAAARPELLMDFVRCAAHRIAEDGYSAIPALTSEPRWSSGSVYVFAMDRSGIQVFSGNPVRVNGRQLQEWSDPRAPSGPFRGRNVISAADAFGESFLYYNAFNPRTARTQRKVAFLKRVTVQGAPVLVGAGYYLAEGDNPNHEHRDFGGRGFRDFDWPP